MARDPIVYVVQPFDQAMRPDLATLDEQWLTFWASQDHHARVISRTQAFNLKGPQQRVDALLHPLEQRFHGYAPLANLVLANQQGESPPDVLDQLAQLTRKLPTALRQEVQETLTLVGGNGNGNGSGNGNGNGNGHHDLDVWTETLDLLGTPIWKRRWLKAERQMYEDFQRRTPLRGLHHYLLVWLPDTARPETQLAAIEAVFDTGVTIGQFPPFLPGAYREMPKYLEPVERGLHPYYAILVAHDLKGTWNIDTLHRLLILDMDIAVSIDVRHISRAHADWIIDFMVASRTNKISEGSGPRDVRAERQLDSAMRIQEMMDSQALHDLLITVAVTAPDPEQLEVNVQRVKSEAGQRLRLTQPAGAQKELLKLFGAVPSNQIATPVKHRRVPSHGVAVTMPFGLRRPDRTDGILWFLMGDTPIMFNPFANKKAAHAIILGETGYGKTFAINVWAMRLLLQGVQVVLYEPQGHSRRLVQAAGKGGARYILTTSQQLNPLDVMVTRGESGEPPSVAQQADYVMGILGVLLGTTQQGGDGKDTFASRVWSPIERGLLGMAMEQLYGSYDLETLKRDRTPLLTELCDALSDQGEEEAKLLAREILIALIKGPNRHIFNARTSVDWNFTHDITAYDFSEIPAGILRVFYYGQAFGALNRYVRSKQRDTRRTLVAQIDEFGYMMKSAESLVDFVAMAAKTWRTFGAHMWTIDQNAHTYLDRDGGGLQTIFQNAPLKVFMRQGVHDAQMLERGVDSLRPAHVKTISTLKRGECVMVWQSDDPAALHDEVYEGYVFANDEEWKSFTGT
jgi:hypothetical protein